MKLVKLSDLINMLEDLPLGGYLFMQGSYPWNEDSLAAVLEIEPYYDPENEPEFAKENNLKFIFFVGDLAQLVENARLQLPSVSIRQLVDAFNYYCDHDAFLEF